MKRKMTKRESMQLEMMKEIWIIENDVRQLHSKTKSLSAKAFVDFDIEQLFVECGDVLKKGKPDEQR